MDKGNLIRFDWAIKRLLRNKACFVVLEGLLSVVLKETVKIKEIKESATNKDSEDDKYNVVDIFVENKKRELMIVEIQNSYHADYFLRMQYAASKSIVEHMRKGDDYYNVRKLFHISIIYFPIQGDDYVYHGGTEFRGLHTGTILSLSDRDRSFLSKNGWKRAKKVKDLYTEYYLLCVEDFDKVAKNRLDEWMHYLKTNTIPDKFKANGLAEAREKLRYDNLSPQEKLDYDYHLECLRSANITIRSAIMQGYVEGEAIGLEKGKAIGLEKGEAIGLRKAESIAKEKIEAEKIEIARNLIKSGVADEVISMSTGLSIKQINKLKDIV
jgi:predicted transposase/invertase (TIGR01784 family)